jgi:acetyl esterase/lipase
VGLDSFYVERFAAVAGVTWEAVFGGDADAIDRAIAFGRPAGPYDPPPMEIRDADAPGPHGPVPVRVYTPLDAVAGGGCLVWMHGGAFKFGDLDMLEAHGVAAELAVRANIVVVSVDYRLVPAFRYPVPVDDCVAVAHWVDAEHRRLDVDPGRLAVGGASAGANLATAVALRTRDEAGPEMRCCCLAYPGLFLDPPDPTPEVAALIEQVPPLSRFAGEARHAIYRDYLGEYYDDPPSYGVPALADLTGLPPFAVAIAEYDDLRPSGDAFAQLLREHDVPVDAWVEPGTAHGYLNAVGVVAGANATLDRFAAHLRVTLDVVRR